MQGGPLGPAWRVPCRLLGGRGWVWRRYGWVWRVYLCCGPVSKGTVPAVASQGGPGRPLHSVSAPMHPQFQVGNTYNKRTSDQGPVRHNLHTSCPPAAASHAGGGTWWGPAGELLVSAALIPVSSAVSCAYQVAGWSSRTPGKPRIPPVWLTLLQLVPHCSQLDPERLPCRSKSHASRPTHPPSPPPLPLQPPAANHPLLKVSPSPCTSACWLAAFTALERCRLSICGPLRHWQPPGRPAQRRRVSVLPRLCARPARCTKCLPTPWLLYCQSLQHAWLLY